ATHTKAVALITISRRPRGSPLGTLLSDIALPPLSTPQASLRNDLPNARSEGQPIRHGGEEVALASRRRTHGQRSPGRTVRHGLLLSGARRRPTRGAPTSLGPAHR